MANASPSRFGAINGDTDKDALFLKVFAGEVLATFEQTTVTMDKHMVRTIASGKSAQFPKVGNITAAYHTPGAEILGQAVNSGEIVVTINDILLSDAFIADIDEAKTHFDVRGIYTKKMGEALANQMDKHVLQTMIQAAQASATLTGDNGGTIITSANSGTDADALVQAILDAAQAMDEKNVPSEGRFAYLKPAQYYLLANSSKVLNVEFGNSGNGSVASGKVYAVGGVTLVKTNNLPTTNITTGVTAGGAATRQAVDARNTTCLVAHTSAAATVKLLDLATEMHYDYRRLGTLMYGKYAVGHAPLRPESAVQIRTATP